MKRCRLLMQQFSLLLLLWSMVGEAASAITTSDETQAVCTVKGRVFTQRQWYGYLVNKAFHQNYAKIVYQITYPVKECCSNLLIYYDDQVKQLKSSMSCEERTAVLPPDNNQIIPLRASNDSNGCIFWNETGEAFYVCRGERIFRSSVPRTWFFALSHCNQKGPLNLNYVFNITGYYGECEEDPLASYSGCKSYGGPNCDQQSSSNQEVYTYLSISLGIVAGIALILAAVFFGLWFLGLRKAAKGKGSSVTSSQATMTQDDIFYVNPSLSDREQAEYSQSGSENYYEVIPERRSYESINTGLANGGAHIRQLRSLHGALGHPLGPPHVHHHPHAHHHTIGHPHHPGHAVHPGHPHLQTKEAGGMRGVTYTFEDYPPPPYQPPKLLGLGKHNALTHIPGHAHSLSVPTAQRQRPQLVHHAYHSSIVPTSAALGMGVMTSGSNVSSSGDGSVSPGVGSATTSGQSSQGMNLMNPLSPSSTHMTINPTSSGMQTISQANLTGPSLGTFGVPQSSSSNTGAGAGSINLSGISGHMSHLPASSASSASATPSLAAALSSVSHVPPPAPGQSETSA